MSLNNEYSDYVIEETKEIALIKLNRIWQTPNKISIIRYYNEEHEVDFLFAIGKASGFGPDYYSIVQSHEETLVISVGTDLYDVATLSHFEKALCFCNPHNEYPESKWFLVEDILNTDNHQYTRTFTELTKPGIYRNLDDGFRWFYSYGTLKREDDFLSGSETIHIIDERIENFRRPKLIITPTNLPEGTCKRGNNYYLPKGTSYLDTFIFHLKIVDYKGEDVTSQYEITVESGEVVEYLGNKLYRVLGRWEEDFELTIQATKETVMLKKTLRIWFPVLAYYGSCTVDGINETINLSNDIQEKVIYHDLRRLIVDYSLNNKRSILIIPHEFEKFLHTYERNGLDYIKNYTFIENYEYSSGVPGIVYNAYVKNEPIVLEEFEQIFTYRDIYRYLAWLNLCDYYTKDEIDELLGDDPVITNEIDYYIGKIGGTRPDFYNIPINTLFENATAYSIEETPRYAYEYGEDDNGLYILYIILRSNVRITSGTLISNCGENSGVMVTNYREQDFSDPRYFSIQASRVVDGVVYNIHGLRGLSLPDPGNIIELNFIK